MKTISNDFVAVEKQIMSYFTIYFSIEQSNHRHPSSPNLLPLYIEGRTDIVPPSGASDVARRGSTAHLQTFA